MNAKPAYCSSHEHDPVSEHLRVVPWGQTHLVLTVDSTDPTAEALQQLERVAAFFLSVTPFLT